MLLHEHRKPNVFLKEIVTWHTHTHTHTQICDTENCLSSFNDNRIREFQEYDKRFVPTEQFPSSIHKFVMKTQLRQGATRLPSPLWN